MTWIQRTLGCAVLAAFTVGSAGAATESCVELCQAKVNSCAEACSDQSNESFDDCQLGCAKLLFPGCVQECGESGAVVWDDYEVRVPEESGE